MASLQTMGHALLCMGCVLAICYIHTCSSTTGGHQRGTACIMDTHDNVMTWMYNRISVVLRTERMVSQWTPTINNQWVRLSESDFDGFFVGNLTSTGSHNGLVPTRRQTIIWTNAGILLIGPLWTNCNVNFSKILAFSFKKIRLNVSSVKWRPFCLGINVLTLAWHHTNGLSFLRCRDESCGFYM